MTTTSRRSNNNNNNNNPFFSPTLNKETDVQGHSTSISVLSRLDSRARDATTYRSNSSMQPWQGVRTETSPISSAYEYDHDYDKDQDIIRPDTYYLPSNPSSAAKAAPFSSVRTLHVFHTTSHLNLRIYKRPPSSSSSSSPSPSPSAPTATPPLYFVRNTHCPFTGPDVTLHSGDSSSGPIVASARWASMCSARIRIGLGDPADVTRGGESGMRWEEMRKESGLLGFNHSVYSMTVEVDGEGKGGAGRTRERRMFVWRRTTDLERLKMKEYRDLDLQNRSRDREDGYGSTTTTTTTTTTYNNNNNNNNNNIKNDYVVHDDDRDDDDDDDGGNGWGRKITLQNFLLEDKETGAVVASFANVSLWSWRKKGKFRILTGVYGEDWEMIVLMSGLALIERARRRERARKNNGGGGP